MIGKALVSSRYGWAMERKKELLDRAYGSWKYAFVLKRLAQFHDRDQCASMASYRVK